MNNIKIIGTTHLVSKEAIEGMIKDYGPDAIGLELCETRYKIFTGELETVTKKEKDKSIVDKITDETKKKAAEENLDYGSDQKSAMFYAINNNLPIALVDMNILDIQESMKGIPAEELVYLQNELVKFKGEKLEREINEDEIITTMKKDIPNVYKILIEDRNNFIANKIFEKATAFPDRKILFFLGKGHVKEVERILEDLNNRGVLQLI